MPRDEVAKAVQVKQGLRDVSSMVKQCANSEASTRAAAQRTSPRRTLQSASRRLLLLGQGTRWPRRHSSRGAHVSVRNGYTAGQICMCVIGGCAAANCEQACAGCLPAMPFLCKVLPPGKLLVDRLSGWLQSPPAGSHLHLQSQTITAGTTTPISSFLFPAGCHGACGCQAGRSHQRSQRCS